MFIHLSFHRMEYGCTFFAQSSPDECLMEMCACKMCEVFWKNQSCIAMCIGSLHKVSQISINTLVDQICFWWTIICRLFWWQSRSAVCNSRRRSCQSRWSTLCKWISSHGGRSHDIVEAPTSHRHQRWWWWLLLLSLLEKQCSNCVWNSLFFLI